MIWTPKEEKARQKQGVPGSPWRKVFLLFPTTLIDGRKAWLETVEYVHWEEMVGIEPLWYTWKDGHYPLDPKIYFFREIKS